MFLETLKAIFDTFGAPVFVPVIIFIISKILKVDTKKSFFSALYAGVGLQGFTLLLNAFTPIITPVVKKMVESTGIQLPVFDVGWQATALVAFSTEAGMVFLGIGLVVQTVLFLSKWTSVFQPGDLWNNYSYMVWGSMVYLVTKNMMLALGCMILLNMYSLLIAELMAKRWSTYYKYPNCTIIAMHNIEAAIFTVVFDPLLNMFGLNKVKLSPQELQKKLGFFGEPVSLGLLLGIFIGIMGNFKNLGTLAAWGQVAVMGIATSSIMAIFPRVAGLFAQAFLPITEAARKSIKKDAIAMDIFPEKLELAKSLGADILINSRECDPVRRIKELTGGGAQVVLETAGSKITQEQAVLAARKQGRVVFLGISHSDLPLQEKTIEAILRGEISLQGSWNSYSAPYPGKAWTATLEFMSQGKLQFAPMISHRIKLEELAHYLAAIADRTISFNKILVEI